MVWQGWAVLAHLLTPLPPPFTTISALLPSLCTRLGPLSKAPSSWEQAGFKCLSPSVIEAATHEVSSVTTQAGLCQGQNEFVGGRKAEGERGDILWRMMNNPKVYWYSAGPMKRGEVKQKKSSKGRSGLAVAGFGLRIVAVKRARLYLFIVGLLKRWWRSGNAPAPQLRYVSWINLWNMSVNNAADVISLFLTCTPATRAVTMVTSSLCCCVEVTILFPWRGKSDNCSSLKVRLCHL